MISEWFCHRFFDGKCCETWKTASRPKRATSSSYGKTQWFWSKIKIWDGRPTNLLCVIFDGNVIENGTNNKQGKIRKKGWKIKDFGSIFGRKRDTKWDKKGDREKGCTREAPFLKKVAPRGSRQSLALALLGFLGHWGGRGGITNKETRSTYYLTRPRPSGLANLFINASVGGLGTDRVTESKLPTWAVFPSCQVFIIVIVTKPGSRLWRFFIGLRCTLGRFRECGWGPPP